MKKIALLACLAMVPWAGARALIFDFTGFVNFASLGGRFGIASGSSVSGYLVTGPADRILEFQIFAGDLMGRNLLPAAETPDGGVIGQWAPAGGPWSNDFDNERCFLLYYGFTAPTAAEISAVCYKDGHWAGMPNFSASLSLVQRVDNNPDAPVPEPSAILLMLTGLLPLGAPLLRRRAAKN